MKKTMIQVKSGSRVLQFQGELIGHSSSKRPGVRGNDRWVEFSLFRTASGVYVLGRVGVSTLYHYPHCAVVTRNRLTAVPAATLNAESTPCALCHPDLAGADEEICPEQDRTWAQVCETPEAVLDSLMQDDAHGSRYLTRVAERLLIDAGAKDAAIDAVYRVEHVR